MDIHFDSDLNDSFVSIVEVLPALFETRLINQDAPGKGELVVQVRFYYNEEEPSAAQFFIVVVKDDEIVGYIPTVFPTFSSGFQAMYNTMSSLVETGVEEAKAQRDANIEMFRDKLNDIIKM